MCEGFYNGLYKLENRDGQYYWHYMYSPNIYNTPYIILNIEHDRENDLFHRRGWMLGDLILFKEQDLLEVKDGNQA